MQKSYDTKRIDDVERKMKEIQEFHEKMEEKYQNLEEKQYNIEQKQQKIDNLLTESVRSIDELSDELKEIQNELSEVESRLEKNDMISQSRIDGLSEITEKLEEKVLDMSSELQSEIDNIEIRMNNIESSITDSDKGELTFSSGDACELKQLSVLSEGLRNEELDKTTQRAVSVFNSFDVISESTIDGRRALSEDILKFLNSDGVNHHTQVHRVMETFDEKTDDRYKLTEVQGLRDSTSQRAIVYSSQ